MYACVSECVCVCICVYVCVYAYGVRWLVRVFKDHTFACLGHSYLIVNISLQSHIFLNPTTPKGSFRSYAFVLSSMVTFPSVFLLYILEHNDLFLSLFEVLSLAEPWV